jgi:putative thioredoxin
MMNEAISGFVINVSEQGFQREVVERSREVPVVVDFWASWCGPCRILGPVLEKLAEESKGGFILAKVDTEQNPMLASQIGIRSIPNVMVFIDGQVVDQFIGALPEHEVRAFLRRYCPTETDRLVAEGIRREEAGEFEAAAQVYDQALRQEPTHAAARLGLARVMLAQGDEAEAQEHLAVIPPLAAEAEQAARLREFIAFHQACRDAGGEDACRQKLAINPNDLDARFALGACLAAAGRFREALEEFLAIVAKDKKHRDEAARKAMLTIFGLVGERSELAEEYRNRLALTLY